MSSSKPKIPASLESALHSAARQYLRRRRARAWLRFATFTLVLLMTCTGVLVLTGESGDSVQAVVLTTFIILEAAGAAYWILYASRRHVSLKQLALYIDERHPELQNRVVSAVEFAGLDASAQAEKSQSGSASAWMIERLLEDTDHVSKGLPVGRLFDERALLWTGRLAAALLAVSACILLASHSLWIPRIQTAWRGLSPVKTQPITFTVSPGNVEVRRGESAVILVEANTPVTDVALAWRPNGGPEQSEPMSAATDPTVWHYDFANIQQDIQYRVQVAGAQSQTYTITTWIPPQTESINLTYHYPEYLKHPDEEAPNGGPISAVEGTRVTLNVEMNKKLQDAALVLESGTRISLTETSEVLWSGEITVASDDRYHVEVADPQGHRSEYEPWYDIKAVPDEHPSVRISFPRGDDEVTPLEEIPFAFKVSDDFGLAAYGIQYEIAGHDPVRVPMSEMPGEVVPPLLSANGDYLLRLENLSLQPGDLVTWTVWAEDGKPGRDEFEILGDPFFLEVRPYRRTFVESVSSAGGGQQQGQPDSDSTSQKQVLIATWNLRRTSLGMREKDFVEKRTTIVQAQSELLKKSKGEGESEQVTDLLSPGHGPTDLMAGSKKQALREQLVEAQQAAIDALNGSNPPDVGSSLSEAMEHEQKAYSLLKKLESAQRSVQLANNSNRGQGQSRGAGQREINQLEMDRNQNFYEEEQSSQPPAAQQASEEMLSALKELTQRQQLANEEMARLISELQQTKTEAEKEEIQRQLKRLEEEMRNNLERLDQMAGEIASGQMERQQARETRQDLADARNQMNRSLENIQQERLQQARASGARAAETLDKMQRELSGYSRTAAAEHLRDLTRQMDELEKRQDDVLANLDRLKKEDQVQNLDALNMQEQEREDLMAAKEALAKKMDAVMQDATKLADGTRESQELLSRKLNDWLRETSQRGLSENMRNNAPLVNFGIWDPLIEKEEKIAQDLRATGESLRKVGGFQTGDDVEAMRMALREIEGVLNGANPQDGQESGGPTGSASHDRAREDVDKSERPTPEQQSSPAQNKGQSDRADQQGEDSSRSSESGESSSKSQPGRSRSSSNEGHGETGGGGNGGYDPDTIDQFITRDYGQWLDAIRNAEALLPDELSQPDGTEQGSTRQRLEGVRESIGRMRREYRTRGVQPQFEGFLDQVVNPLTEAAAQIDKAIRDRTRDDEFALAHEAEVPAQFKDSVAEYFRKLSEATVAGE